jgi:hypothetical protein
MSNEQGYGDRPEIFAYHRLGRVLSFSFNEEMADRVATELREHREALEAEGQRVTAPLYKFEQTLQRLLERPAPHVDDHRVEDRAVSA